VSDVVVLCYHAVADDWAADLCVTPDRLEAQLQLLVDRGYRGATFREAVLAPPASRTVAVTFDDAFRSVIQRAFPVLERLRLPGTVFAVTGVVGQPPPMSWPGIDRWIGGPHEPELECMSWDELGRLADSGWEIGSHTHSHPRLTTLDDQTLDEELVTSREVCAKRLGRTCASLGYPYGDHDPRVIVAARRAGYEAAGTLPGPLHPPEPLRWPRVGVYHRDDARRFRAKVSPLVRGLRASRAWHRLATSIR